MALAFALTAPTASLAQSPGGWSPEPFVTPTNNSFRESKISHTQASESVPHNRLRGDNSIQPAAGFQAVSTEPVVARWKSPNSASSVKPQAAAPLERVQATDVFAQTATAKTSDLATPSIQAKSSTRRQSLPPVNQPNTIEANFDYVLDAPPRVIRKNRANVTPEVQQASTWTNRQIEGQASLARQQSSRVQVAAYQTSSQSQEAPALNEPGFNIPSLPEATIPNSLESFPPFQSRGALNDQPPETLPPGSNAPSTRSLIEPQNIPPARNPFPPSSGNSLNDPLNNVQSGSRSGSIGESPSDLEMENDFRRQPPRPSPLQTPPKSKSNKRLGVDCDDVRSRAMATDIATIKLNVAPKFGIGPNDKTSTEQKRLKFAQSAPLRQWYDSSGRPLADGRMVDMEYDSVIIESASGEQLALSIRELSDADTVYVSESWGLPVTCSLGDQTFASRSFEPTTVAWKASGLCHKPLYFEEIQLERSGHEWGPVIQPVLSTAHFFTNVAFLPYKMAINPMTECQYALGHYRPGSCAPWSIEPIPLSLKGLAAQGAAIGGAAMILP